MVGTLAGVVRNLRDRIEIGRGRGREDRAAGLMRWCGRIAAKELRAFVALRIRENPSRIPGEWLAWGGSHGSLARFSEPPRAEPRNCGLL